MPINTDLYTNTWEIMKAIKFNLRKYLEVKGNLKGFPKIKSWQLGYIFPDNVYPALSIFPVSKTFLGKRGGGDETVEYVMSIDVVSNRRVDQDDAKRFCIDTNDEIKEAIKYSIKMIGKDGIQNSFSTEIDSQIIFEPIAGASQGFSSSSSTLVTFRAYHTMNTNRIRVNDIVISDYNTFFTKLFSFVKKDMTVDVRQWDKLTGKRVLRTPAIIMLPGNESLLEERSNQFALLSRPVTFHVLLTGLPKVKLVKENVFLTDKLVEAIEKNYMVGGQAQEMNMTTIDYGNINEAGFSFVSTIEVDYVSRGSYETVYN